MPGNNRQLTGKHESLWLATSSAPEYPPLPGDAIVDVAVIGGGIVGITAALLLKNAGWKVAVVEMGRLLRGVTGHTTSKVTSLHRLIYKHLVDNFSREQAQQYADANQQAIEIIADLAQKNGIDCDFIRQHAYTYVQTLEYEDKVRQEVETAQSLGLPASWVDQIPLPIKTLGAVRFDNQAQFHPGKYLRGLAAKIPGNDSFVFEQTHVHDFEGNGPFTIRTNHGTITARDIIVATHFPIFDKGGFYFARMSPSRSYVMAVRIDESFPDGMYLGAESQSLSFRSQQIGGEEFIIVADNEHHTGQGGDTVKCFQKLEAAARKVYDLHSIEYYWSTQDNMTVDRVPYIGKLSSAHDRIYVATGFDKWGMTNGTAAAVILSDLIQGRDNPWASLFAPSRFKPLTSGKSFIEQNTGVVQKYLASRLAKPRATVASLQPGEGKIVRDGNTTVAAYKDDQGNVYKLKPACTHMGCNVTWNNAERSWDCPCHGSRFNYDGRVIQTPAINDLAKVENASKSSDNG